MHGLYYALLHLWFQVVPYSPFALRLPSALAVGGTVAVLVSLGCALAGRRAGLAAGAVGALLPALTWAGGEGRSYALTALAATAASGALVHAITLAARHASRRRQRIAWIAYGLLAAFACALFVYLVLLVAAHLVTVLIANRRMRGASLLRPFAAAVGIAAVAAIPVALLAASETAQISWVDPLSLATVVGVLVNQWFTADPVYAVVAWGAIVVAAIAAIRRRQEVPAGEPNAAVAPVTITSVAVPWLILPLGLVLAASATGGTYYLPRYLTFAAPAIAVILGVIIARARPRTGLALLAALSILAVPTLIGSRLPTAKQHSGWSQIAAIATRERALEPASTTPDAVVYGRLASHQTATAHLVELAYPTAFAGATDVTQIEPLATTSRLWEPRRALSASIDRLDESDTVWLLTDADTTDRSDDTALLTDQGFHAAGSWTAQDLTLTRFTR